MALAIGNQVRTVLENKEALEKSLQLVIRAPWESSGLAPDNAFTTVMVLRAINIIAEYSELPASVLTATRKRDGKDMTVVDIARALVEKSPQSVAVDNYPPSATIAYWLIDAVAGLKLTVDDEPLVRLVEWAIDEFNRQHVLTTAGFEALKDPVSLGMATCLLAKLEHFSRDHTARPKVADRLPSRFELEDGIEQVFRTQLTSGIWAKYFPLFQYRDPAGGANYCFSFEMLEAMLREFGNSTVFEREPCIVGLQRAVEWCERNRLELEHRKVPYRGWNSGGQAKTLREGAPESWATATIHMFLRELDRVTSALIQRHLLLEYNASPRSTPDPSDWDRLIDVPVEIQGSTSSIKQELGRQIIEPLMSDQDALAARKAIGGGKAVLLFGPPGTAKTRMVRSLARRLGWPFLEITPSHFLRDDLSGIYSRSTELFDDLMDLTGCVVLLDEMDSLVQSRGKKDGDRLDVTRELLTTSMLPKLAALHDRARVLLFMNTNYQSTLDDAIKRPGRFDLLLFVGPPPWDAKIASIHVWWKQLPESDHAAARALLDSYAPLGSAVRKTLDLFTVDETNSFVQALAGKGGQKDALVVLGAKDFGKHAMAWGEKYITLRAKGDWIKDYKDDKRASRRQGSS
jgi:hypothetical protein